MENPIDNKINIKFMINDLFDDNNDNGHNSSDDESLCNDSNVKDLDTLWIQEHERLSTIQENYLREPMDSVNVYYVYINRNQYIEKIINDKLPLFLSKDKTHSYLSKENLLQIIQSRKIKTPLSKYKLTDILSYLVDLEPENIQSFSNNEILEQSTSSFLKVCSFIDDIQFNNSIFIFHGVNSIYFLFEEVEIVNHRHTLKSILKTSTQESSISNKTTTKKVRIQEGNIDNRNKIINKKLRRGTRKASNI
jgi:hypothetical protein